MLYLQKLKCMRVFQEYLEGKRCSHDPELEVIQKQTNKRGKKCRGKYEAINKESNKNSQQSEKQIAMKN